MNKSNARIGDLHSQVAQWLRENKTDEVITGLLMERGLDKFAAGMLVKNVKLAMDERKEFYKYLFGGVLILLIGLGMTFTTFSMVAPLHVYIISIGLALAGVIAMISAYINFRQGGSAATHP